MGKRCIHGRQKYICKECRGGGICEHDRIRRQCVPCKGANICEHNRIRTSCKQCKGGAICEHNRIRSKCQECDGGSICEHNKVRSRCVECKGGSICEHNRRRNSCTQCGGTSICEHKRVRSQCTECHGNGICEHNRVRSTCAPCGGGSICEHNRRRSDCIECEGGSICQHNRRRSRCEECGGRELCSTPMCEMRRNSKYAPYCFRCFVFNNPDSPLVRNFKTKELAVRDFILENFPNIDWVSDKKVAEGCSLRRPDLIADFGSHVLFLEVDENGHDFGYTCETKRTCELWNDIGQRNCVFLRFNPDKYYDKDNLKIPSCWKKNAQGLSVINDAQAWETRLQVLKVAVEAIVVTVPKKLIEVQELFFNVCVE